MDENEDISFPFVCVREAAVTDTDGCEASEPTSPPRENDSSWEMVIASYNDWSIFPPNLHEGLYVCSEPYQTLSPHVPQHQTGAAILPYFQKKEKGDEGTNYRSKPLLISAQRMIVPWIELFRSKISGRCEGTAGMFGVGICVFAALAGFFLYFRRRQRPEKEFLLSLIQEKNQKIELLLHQIAELNAILAALRKAPEPCKV